MRTIKFRAWQSKTKRWLSVLHFMIRPDGRVDPFVLPCNESMEHIILVQYTGLKDKNGKEIYEGDIIKFGNFPKVVEFGIRKQNAVYGHGSNGQDLYSGFKIDGYYFNTETPNFEIIGNIHENPELL